jgi:hypothetical protein
MARKRQVVRSHEKLAQLENRRAGIIAEISLRERPKLNQLRVKGHSLPMIGKLLGHKVAATTQRYAHLARDAVSAVSDELGLVLQAAIDRKQPQSAKVVKLSGRRRESE